MSKKKDINTLRRNKVYAASMSFEWQSRDFSRRVIKCEIKAAELTLIKAIKTAQDKGK